MAEVEQRVTGPVEAVSRAGSQVGPDLQGVEEHSAWRVFVAALSAMAIAEERAAVSNAAAAVAEGIFSERAGSPAPASSWARDVSLAWALVALDLAAARAPVLAPLRASARAGASAAATRRDKALGEERPPGGPRAVRREIREPGKKTPRGAGSGRAAKGRDR